MQLWKAGLSNLAGTAVLVLTLLPTALDAQAPPAAAADTFEVRVQNSPALRIAADALTYQQHRMVTLERDGDVVAVFQMHQLIYITNLTRGGSRTFELQANDGSSYMLRGDRLVPEQTGFIRVEGPGGLTGVISFNSLRYVMARELRTGR